MLLWLGVVEERCSCAEPQFEVKHMRTGLLLHVCELAHACAARAYCMWSCKYVSRAFVLTKRVRGGPGMGR